MKEDETSCGRLVLVLIAVCVVSSFLVRKRNAEGAATSLVVSLADIQTEQRRTYGCMSAWSMDDG